MKIPSLRRLTLAGCALFAGLLAAQTARAQWVWSVYNGSGAPVSSYTDGSGNTWTTANPQAGGDLSSGTTVSFVIPPSTQYEIATSNFTPFSLTTAGTTYYNGNMVQATFNLSLGGLLAGKTITNPLVSFGMIKDLDTANTLGTSSSSSGGAVTQYFNTLTENGVFDVLGGSGFKPYDTTVSGVSGVYDSNMGSAANATNGVTFGAGSSSQTAATYYTGLAAGNDTFLGLVQWGAGTISAGTISPNFGKSSTIAAMTEVLSSPTNPGWVSGCAQGMILVGTGFSSLNGLSATQLAAATNCGTMYGGTASGKTGLTNVTATFNTFAIGLVNAGTTPATVTLSKLGINYENGSASGTTITYTAVNGTTGITTVNPRSAPLFGLQPTSSGSINAGGSFTLQVGGTLSNTGSVYANGSDPITGYQWYFNGTAMSDGTDPDGSVISGSTTTSLTLTNAGTTHGSSVGTYALKVTNDIGTTSSLAISQPVASAGTQATVGSITSSPTDSTVSVNGNLILSAPLAGTDPITYQWFLNGSAITGATSTSAATVSLSLSSLQLSQAGSYTVSVVNAYNSGGTPNTSTAYNVTVATVPTQTSGLGVTPAVNAGTTVTFNVTAAGNASYQWALNGTAISGATSSTINLGAVTQSQAGSYTAIVTGSNGTVTESGYLLTVIDTSLTLASSSPQLPASGAANVPYDAPLFAYFNTSALSLGNHGQIRLYNSSNTLISTIDLSTLGRPLAGYNYGDNGLSGSESVQGTTGWKYDPIMISHDYANRVQIQFPNGTLQPATSYYVEIDPGVVLDANGSYAGITNTTGWTFTTKAALTAPTSPTTLVVAADNSGDFATVQGALDLLYGNGNTGTVTQLQSSAPRVTIYIKNGFYEQLVFSRGLYNVTYEGQSRTGAVIEYGNNQSLNGSNTTPGGAYTRGLFEIFGDGLSSSLANDLPLNTVIQNLSILNITPQNYGTTSSGLAVQAEALITGANQTTINNVTFLSYQDTIQTNGTTYFNDCHISGDVDFIWGIGASFFTNCEITELSSSHYFVQSRNAQPSGTTNHGYVFVGCKLDGAAGVNGDYLARDGGFPNNEVAYINCSILDDVSGPLINSAGWNNEGYGSSGYNWVWYNLTNYGGITPYSTTGWNSWPGLLAPGTNESDGIAEYLDLQNPAYVLNQWVPLLTPIFTTQPVGSVSGVTGGSTTLTASAIAAPDPTYQWSVNGTALTDGTQSDGSVISGSATASLTITNAGTAEAGSYAVVATAANAATTYNSASSSSATSSASVVTFTAPTPPSISVQPSTQYVGLTNSITLSVTASGNPAPSYQWFFDGVAISGATSSTYTASNAVMANGGYYEVVVSNSDGHVLSTNVPVYVGQAPSIVVQPSSTTVATGASVTLAAVAHGTALSYQWDLNGTAIPSATSASYTIASATSANNGSYTLVASNLYGAPATSNAATLTVDTAPAITTQPTTQNVAVTGTITLTVAASGTPAPGYQWFFDGVPISGATSSTYTLASAVVANSGYYEAVASNTLGGVLSANVPVYVRAAPTIAVQPASSVTAVTGYAVTLSAVANGTSLSYQWDLNGTAIPSATASSYTIASASAGSAGSYTLVVNSPYGSVTSNAATVTVDTLPSITTQPSTQYVATSGTITLTVAASGTPAPSVYQWFFDGVPISGATSSTYTLASPVIANGGYYEVVVSNTVGAVLSSNVPVYVGQAASIVNQPSSVTQRVGYAARFYGAAQGTISGYQWDFNGTAISGATSTTYSISSVTTGNAGSYTLVASSLYGAATSSPATLTVDVLPSITTQPANEVADTGGAIALSVTATGTPAPSGYQWYFNATAISGATSSTLTITQATQANAGRYQVIVTSTLASIASAQASVAVRAPELAYADGLVQSGTQGGLSASFAVTGGTRPVIIVGVGPGLGIGGSLAAPVLSIYNGSSALVYSNTNWQTAPGSATVQAIAQGYAGVTLTSGNADSAFLIYLASGSYKVVLTGVSGGTGLGVLGVYDVSGLASEAAAGKTQGSVTSTEPLTAGFLVTGGSPATVLVTAIGPGLSSQGINSPLDAPTLTVVDSTGAVQATNTGYGTAGNSAAIAAAASSDLGYTLQSGDSGALLTLNPGAYTATASSSDATSGVAEIDAYQQ